MKKIFKEKADREATNRLEILKTHKLYELKQVMKKNLFENFLDIRKAIPLK